LSLERKQDDDYDDDDDMPSLDSNFLFQIWKLTFLHSSDTNLFPRHLNSLSYDLITAIDRQLFGSCHYKFNIITRNNYEVITIHYENGNFER
jgi:hypothetical protein